MREKVIVDEQYHVRLLKYISHLVIETLPPNVSDDDVAEQFGKREFGPRPFCPFPQPGSEEFELQKQLDLYDLLLSQTLHCENHTSTCFKYGNTKCRSKFPRSPVEETRMDPETGLIQLKCDHAWLNGYNPWI